MKNLFIIKRITEDKTLSDEAFAVWCALRDIMRQDTTEYFVSFNMIAHSMFNRPPERYEMVAIKKGYTELVEREFIKVIDTYSKSEFIVDLSTLYYEKGSEHFANLSMEEMQKIMNIDCGRHSNYKLLRYFTAQVGSFNQSADMCRYKGKIGGMSLDYFSELIPITKPTCIAFNEILEKNEMLFIIRHKDFFQFINDNMTSEVREIPNTYSRWADQELAKMYAEDTHGYKYFEEQKNVKTKEANRKRGLGQKLNRFFNGIEYDIATIEELYVYAKERNAKIKAQYDKDVKNGYKPSEPYYYDMSKFDYYKIDFQNEENWGE